MTDGRELRDEIQEYRAGQDTFDASRIKQEGKRFSSVDSLKGDFPSGDRFCVQGAGIPFECFCHFPQEAPPSWLYVIYSGSASQKEIGEGTPVFRRWGYYPILASLGGATLCIADPMIHRHKIPLGWYYGTQDTSFCALSLEIVKAFCSHCHIPNDRVIFLGSSGGGHAAIYAASLLEGSLSVAIHPTVDLHAHPLAPQFGEATGIDLGMPDPLHRNDLAHMIRESSSRYCILFNVEDDRDMGCDALPLCRALGIAPKYGLSAGERVLLWLHDAPPAAGDAHSAQETRRVFLAIDRVAKDFQAGGSVEAMDSQVLLVNELWHDIYLEKKAAYDARVRLSRITCIAWLHDMYPVRMRSRNIVFQEFSVEMEAGKSRNCVYTYKDFVPHRWYTILLETDGDYPEHTVRLYDENLKQSIVDRLVPVGRRNYFNFLTKEDGNFSFFVYAGEAGRTQGKRLFIKRLAVMACPDSNLVTEYEEEDDRRNEWEPVSWYDACRHALARNPWTSGSSIDDYDHYALPWRELFELQHILEEQRPMNVLELGLGETSKLLVRYARTSGANVVILDEDEEWSRGFMERDREVFQSAKVYIRPLSTKEQGGYRYCEFKGFDQVLGDVRFQLVVLHRSRGSGDCLPHGEWAERFPGILAERFCLFVEHGDESEEQRLLREVSLLCEEHSIPARMSFVPLKDGELCIVSS